MFAAKIRRVQQVLHQNFTEKKQFATWCFVNMHSNSTFLGRIIFPDKCVFHISRIANNQNVWFWGPDNPRLIQGTEGHSKKITVWCAGHSNGVLDTYYFDNERE